MNLTMQTFRYDLALEMALLNESEHDYSSTQIDIDGKIKQDILNFSKSIPDELLAEKGREDKIHVTVKYGIHNNDPDDFKNEVAKFPKFTITLGKLSKFTNDDYDVLKIDIISPELHKLNKLISSSTECTDTHPDYKPHLTIAYLKPGEADRYLGDKRIGLDGRKISVYNITFSDKNRDKSTLKLKGDNHATNRGTNREEGQGG